MRIFVKAKPNSKTEYVKQIGDGNFEVAVKEPPIQGKANAAIVKILAQHFSVSASSVKIISGWSLKQKIIEIK